MKVNYKSDFSLVIQLTAGGEAVAVPTWDWSMIFYTCDRQAVYQCSRIGGVCDRCTVNADGTVTVYFDKHGLRPGVLVCEFCNHIPDTNFSFDKRITFDPVTLGVELVSGAGDEGMTPVELELAGDLLAQLQAIIEGLDVATDYVVNLSALWNDEENCFVAPPLPSGPGLPSWATIHHDALAALAEGRVVRYKVALLVDVSDVGYRVHDFAVASYNATAPTSVIKAVGYEDDTDNATPELFSLYHTESGVRVYSRDVATLEAVEEAVAPLQPRLTAGTGIDITNNVISATGGGGGDALIVTLTPSQGDQFTPDKTFSEASAAYAAGRKVLFSINQEGITVLVDVYFSLSASDIHIGALSGMAYSYDADGDVVATFVWNLSSPYVVRTQTILQPKLTAGSGITIANNVISANIPDGAYIIDVDMDTEPMTTTAVFADALAAFESGRQVWFAGTSGGDLVFSVPMTLNYGDFILAGITWMEGQQQTFTFTANGVSFIQTDYVNTTALSTALAGKQDVLTFDNVPTQSSSNPVKSGGVYDAFSTYCPIIEDTRSSAVAAITGVAPFASLVNGQRIVLHLAYNAPINSTLNLTNTTFGDVNIFFQLNSAIMRLSNGAFLAGGFYELIYDATNSRWVNFGHDFNTTYATMTQAEVDAGSSTATRVVTPKLLCDNFSNVTTLVEVTATGDVTQALDSGKFYRFGSVDSLTLTFTAPSAGMGMWGGKFTASASWSALGIPATIDEAAGNDTIASGKTYEFNVLDGIIVIKEV